MANTDFFLVVTVASPCNAVSPVMILDEGVHMPVFKFSADTLVRRCHITTLFMLHFLL
jgi:hypothetical protein